MFEIIDDTGVVESFSSVGFARDRFSMYQSGTYDAEWVGEVKLVQVLAVQHQSGGDRVLAAMPKTTTILAHGNPADGFTFEGPITPNDPELERYIDSDLRNETWWYITVKPLPLRSEQ